MDTKKLKTFYSQRLKNPNLFTYDLEGNLIQKDKDGSVIGTMVLSFYRSPTIEEHSEVFIKRKQAIAQEENIFETEFKKLRNLLNSGASDDEILRQNRIVEQADKTLQSVRFPLRMGYFTDSVDINKVLFENRFETRKMPYRLSSTLSYPFDLQTLYVRDSPISAVPTSSPSLPVKNTSTSNKSTRRRSSRPVILFSRPETNEYGYLSMQWPVNFEYNSSIYMNAHQALLAEMAKNYRDESGYSMIMASETPDDIIYTKDDVGHQSDLTDESWNQHIISLITPIIRSKFKQHLELGIKLIQTGNSELGSVEPGDTLLGIGIALGDDALISKNWSGQNMIGKALEQVRSELIKESVTTSAVVTAIPPLKSKSIRLRRAVAKPVAVAAVASGI